MVLQSGLVRSHGRLGVCFYKGPWLRRPPIRSNRTFRVEAPRSEPRGLRTAPEQGLRTAPEQRLRTARREEASKFYSHLSPRLREHGGVERQRGGRSRL